MDGKADITVYRPSDFYWYIYRSYDGGFNFTKLGYQYAVPMAVDTNGDGVMEIVVYRNRNCEWNPECPSITGVWYTKSNLDSIWGVYGEEDAAPLRLRLPN